MRINKNKFSNEFSAMVLSAGLGTRLKPLTDFIPKPLAPLCGRALLLRILDKIFSSGAESIAVNLHHKSAEIIRAVNSVYRGRIFFSPERNILGTGGALLKCKEFLSKREFFLLHNGDIISSVDLQELIKFHLDSGAAGTLLLVDGEDNKISLKRGRISGIKGYCGCENRKLYTYSGIAVFSRGIFEYFPEGKDKFPLIEVFKKAIEAGELGGLAPEKVYWRDIGSLENYFSVHEDILLKQMFIPDRLSEPPCPADSGCKISGFLSLPENGNFEIRKGAKLQNCIILEGGIVYEDEFRNNEVIGKDFSVHRDSALIMNLPFFKDCDFRKN